MVFYPFAPFLQVNRLFLLQFIELVNFHFLRLQQHHMRLYLIQLLFEIWNKNGTSRLILILGLLVVGGLDLLRNFLDPHIDSFLPFGLRLNMRKQHDKLSLALPFLGSLRPLYLIRDFCGAGWQLQCLLQRITAFGQLSRPYGVVAVVLRLTLVHWASHL